MSGVRSLGVVAGLVLAATLAGCGGAGEPSASSVAARFPGPWASELAEMVESLPSEFSERAFEDGVVSEQELAEAEQIVQECFRAAGLTATWDAYGYETVSGAGTDGDEPPDSIGECSFADGGVMVMYYRMLVNPQHEDEMALSAQCLVDAGVVEPGYTGQDLQQAYDSDDTEDLPGAPGDERFARCMMDPLGLVGENS